MRANEGSEGWLAENGRGERPCRFETLWWDTDGAGDTHRRSDVGHLREVSK